MAQSSFRLEGNKYALALDSYWQAEIETAGSLKHLCEQMNIAMDDGLHARIKGSGGLAKFLDAQMGNDNDALSIVYDEPAPLAISSKEDLQLALSGSVQSKLAMNELFAEWLSQHQHKLKASFEQWCRSMDIKLDLPEEENAWAYNRLEDTFNGKLKNGLIHRMKLASGDRLDRDILMSYTAKQIQAASDAYCAFCRANGAGTVAPLSIANQLIADIEEQARNRFICQAADAIGRIVSLELRPELMSETCEAASKLGILEEALERSNKPVIGESFKRMLDYLPAMQKYMPWKQFKQLTSDVKAATQAYKQELHENKLESQRQRKLDEEAHSKQYIVQFPTRALERLELAKEQWAEVFADNAIAYSDAMLDEIKGELCTLHLFEGTANRALYEQWANHFGCIANEEYDIQWQIIKGASNV